MNLGQQVFSWHIRDGEQKVTAGFWLGMIHNTGT